MSAQALNYTGVLNLKHKVQQRTLRASSIDAHYVAAAYKYMRSYGLWLQEQLEEANNKFYVISASCDAKCKVPPRFLCAPFPLYLFIRIHNLMKCLILSLSFVQVNVGEPSLPIQLASRGKACIVPTGFDLVAGDHDFHVVNLTPSVTLLTEVKADPDGSGKLPSFYKGAHYYL